MKQLKNMEYEEFRQYLYNRAHGYIWTPDTLELICRVNDNDPERIGRQILEVIGRLRNEQVSHRTNDKRRKYVIRSLREGETDLLKTFLYEAIFVPEGAEPFERSIIEKPELALYYEDFGSGPADFCLAAERNGKVVGAVWTRIMNDYGHVDDETPSLAISLYKEYRGKGIGTALMEKMSELLREKGFKKVSLSVQKANYAVRMYEALGFRPVIDKDDEYIMVREL
jgi:ribosomal protein S18 acetylase RimI-like enzyme